MNPCSILVELTHSCNLNCIYCYQAHDKKISSPILGFKDYLEIFKKILHNAPIDSVTLMGGEPLLYPDLIPLIKGLKSLGLSIGIATNATLLNKKNIERLIHAGVSSFEISLDSYHPETLAAMTGNKEIQKLKENLLEIKKQKCFLAVNCVLTKINSQEIVDLIQISSAFSINRILLSPLALVGNEVFQQRKLVLTFSELKDILNLASNEALKQNQKVVAGYPFPFCIINPLDFPGIEIGVCSCGKTKWLIDPAGNLKTCEFSSNKLGSLLEQNLEEIISFKDAIDFKDKPFKKECMDCKKNKECSGGCRFIQWDEK